MLPALGAIAAGPAGAALGAVAQAVFQSPLKQMARTLYRVQGSWSEPKIDVIDRGPAGSPAVGDRERRRAGLFNAKTQRSAEQEKQGAQDEPEAKGANLE